MVVRIVRCTADHGSGVVALAQYINADGSVSPTLVTTYTGESGLAHLPKIREAYQMLSESGSPRERAAGIEGLAVLQTTEIENVVVSHTQALTAANGDTQVRVQSTTGDICSITLLGWERNGHPVKHVTTWTMGAISNDSRAFSARRAGAEDRAQLSEAPTQTSANPPRSTGIREARRPAIFFYNALGDHLLTRPAILALQKFYKGQLGYIGAAEMAATFFPDADFRFSHVIPLKPSLDGGSPDFDPADVLAIADDFDALIILNPWNSAQLEDLANRIRPRPVLALAREYGDVVPLRRGVHYAEYAFSVARFLDPTASLNEFVSVPPVPAINRHRAEYILGLLPSGVRILCVNTSTRAEKQWPRECFRQLLRQFLGRRPEYLALVVDDSDADLDQADLMSRVFTLDGVDLQTATALVAAADLFVGIDSYFLHVADFAKVPSVGLFGPTDPDLWGVRFARHIHVSAPAMSEISVDRVMEALDRLVVEGKAAPGRVCP